MDEHFPSHSGHGLGLGHPEPPYLVPESTETLQSGDVVALEPGLYVPGVGGMRFERNYLITDGHETLTRHRLGLTRRSRVARSSTTPLESDQAPAADFRAAQGRLVVGLVGDLGHDLGVA